MAYLPELQERMRRELHERLAKAEADIAILIPIVQQQDRYIRGSLPTTPAEWDERERLISEVNMLRDRANLGDLG